MCECKERGFSMVFGLTSIGCNEKPNIYCKTCVEVGEKLFKEYFSNFSIHENVENISNEK